MAYSVRSDYWQEALRGMNIVSGNKVEILVDTFDKTEPDEGVIRIVVIREPTRNLIKDVMEYRHCYNYVFTYHQEILDASPLAVKFIQADTWVDKSLKRNKTFSVSTVVGGKTHPPFPGYKLRHELWSRRKEITIPSLFYLSSHYPYKQVDYTNELVLGDSKEPLFDSMFHIAIENVHTENLFTEKIMDCFLSRTIPVYIGTPNLDKYFNIDGVFMCRNIDDVVRVCNTLSLDVYHDKQNAIEENYNIAANMPSLKKVMEETINKILRNDT